MRALLIAVLVVGGLIIGGLLIAPSFIPQEWYREPIISAIEEETGRDVTIKGDIGLSLFPQFNFQMEGVSIANAEGAKHPIMASMKTLDIGVDVFRMMQSEIVITRFVLEEPVIHAEVDRHGKSNFDFGSAQKDPEPQTAPPSEDSGDVPPSPDETQEEFRIGTVSLGDVRLTDGLVTYTNHQTGENYEASDINASVSLPNYDGPFSVDGSLTWLGENIAANISVGNLKSLVEGAETAVSTRIKSALITQSFEGNAMGDRLQSIAGKASLDIPSLRKLSAWLGSPMPDGEGFGPVAITGDLTARNERLLFKNADVRFDDIKATGGLTLILDGEIPYVSGRMDAETLNLNLYLGDSSTDGKPAAQANGGSSTSPAAGQSDGVAPSSGPQEGGNPPATGWSDAPIDLAGLKSLNANLKLTAKQVLIGGVKLNNSDLDLKINDGLLTASLDKTALYKGTGSAKLIADGRGATPKITQTFALSAIDLLPLFSDAGGMDRIEGTGNMALNITMRGRSQRQMMQNLNGTGNINFLDGAIRGINLADMVRNIQSAFGGARNTGAQKTDFAELSGAFNIRNGVLSNTDLLLLNPLLRLTGRGSINIPNRTLNYRFVPKAVSTIEGQGGTRDVTGISVPVIVSGSWDNPTFAPDLAAVIGGVFSGGQDGNSEEPADPVETLLKGVLGLPGNDNNEQENQQSDKNTQPEQQPTDPLQDLFKILQNQ